MTQSDRKKSYEYLKTLGINVNCYIQTYGKNNILLDFQQAERGVSTQRIQFSHADTTNNIFYYRFNK